MTIRVRVLNFEDDRKELEFEDNKKKIENEFKEKLKVLTPEYVKQLNLGIAARIKAQEARQAEALKDIEKGVFR